HEVLSEIGVAEKPELLLLNKIDTPEGQDKFPEWRTIHPDAIPLSAKTGRGQLSEVLLEADSANGKLISFIETNTVVHDRQFKGRRVTMRATVPMRVLADLSRNNQVEIKPVHPPPA